MGGVPMGLAWAMGRAVLGSEKDCRTGRFYGFYGSLGYGCLFSSSRLIFPLLKIIPPGFFSYLCLIR